MTRGPGGSRGFGAARACALGVAFVVAFGAVCFRAAGARVRGRQKPSANKKAKDETGARALYRITLSLDFARGYQGTESVRWTNRDDRPASVLYFHLYPNVRADEDTVRRLFRGGAGDQCEAED